MGMFKNLFLILFVFTLGLPSWSRASSRPTYGGAEWGYESTLAQQVQYAESVLPSLLRGWNLKLVAQSTDVDVLKDKASLEFQRYYRNAQGQVVYYDFVPRTLKFLVEDSAGQVFQGKLYLIERVTESPEATDHRNSSAVDFKEIRLGKNVRLSLARSLNSMDFPLELQLSDYEFKPVTEHSVVGSTSAQRINYLYKQLQRRFRSTDLQVIPESIHVAYYVTPGKIYKFKDRYGHAVSFLLQDSVGNRFSSHVLLWRTNRSYQQVTYPINSTLKTQRELLTTNSFSLWLAQGYRNADSSLELSAKDFWLTPLVSPQRVQAQLPKGSGAGPVETSDRCKEMF